MLAVAWISDSLTVGGIAAGILAVGALSRKGWRAARTVIRWGQRVEAAVIAVETDLKKNNGGSSTKDRLDRIDGRLAAVEEYITNPKEQQ